eukprot:CAMPEP_0205827286 /NCGR_PEP_ID=MMETSP0206-20130828/31478_1 /ASSEMBLY_ACC=CAM_ASM_000279 /TAXON_ID=36767 /ORGANISM="Euplotes focardii, Strain TN1" /LENGTH=79 /DNA_ID=CAMNT_0053128049 /DNA_START=1416 /DNA_END=1655 /DNA_ORIENTATION=+
MSSNWITDKFGKDLVINGNEEINLKEEKYTQPQVVVLYDSSDQESMGLNKIGGDEYKKAIFSDIKLVVEEEISESSDSE